MTREDIAALYRLQQTDSAIAEREALLAGLDDGSAAQTELDQQQARLEQAQEKLHQQQAEHRDLELELKGVGEEKREKHDRAYGGRVSDVKELSALAQKLQELARNEDRLEEKILTLLDEIEGTEAELAQQQKLVDDLAGRLREITTTNEQQTQRARKELDELRAGREELAPTIDGGLLRQYDELRARLDGVAIVAVEGRVCTGCNVALPRSTEVRGRRGDTVVKCESCRRMLFFGQESE